MTAFFPSSHLIKDFIISLKEEGLSGAFGETSVEVVFFSGLAMDAGFIIDSAESLTSWLATRWSGEPDLSELNGSFAAILKYSGMISIWNDLYGMISLFYFRDEHTTIISNRLHLVSREMRRNGLKRTPEYGAIFASLSSGNLFFQQAHSHETQIAGVLLVPVDEYIVLSNLGFAKRKKTAMSRALTTTGCCESEYRDLIGKAAKDIALNVTALVNYPGFRSVYSDLSGGIDSRVVFGALLQAGLLDRIGVRTFKSTTQNDLEIGCGIAQLFAGQFFAGDDRTRFSKRTEFGLTLWRSMKAGSHHRIAFSNWPSPPFARPALHLSGASGEVFRNFWLQACFPNHGSTAYDLEFHQSLFRRASRPTKHQHQVRAFDSFVCSLEGLPGDGHLEKFESHYLFFRNRFHFGITQYNLWFGYFDASILNTPSLLKAWSALPRDDRRNGRVLFDVTDRLAPILNCLPYSNGFRWPEGVASKSGVYRDLLDGMPTLAIEEGLNAWTQANRREAEIRLSHEIAVDPVSENVGITTLAIQAAKSALRALCDSDDMLASFFDGDFYRWFEKQIETSPRHSLETASKIIAIYDLCFDDDDNFLSLCDLPLAEKYLPDHRNAVTVLGAESLG